MSQTMIASDLTKLAAFKLRAECMVDVCRFMKRLQCIDTKVETNPLFPDVTFQFKTSLSVQEIRDLLNSIPDAHVMAQTIQPVVSYTGERRQ